MRQLSLLSLIAVLVAATGCCSTSPFSAGPECIPPAAAAPMAAAPESMCGPLPAEAKPGEVWCCTKFEAPAAPPTRVCVQPECQREIPVPAVYETISETFEVSPAHTDWQKVACNNEQGGGECWKLVTTSAVFETVQRQRLVTPASVRYECVPAVYQDVPGAPMPPVYRWKLNPECESAPAAASAVAPAK